MREVDLDIVIGQRTFLGFLRYKDFTGTYEWCDTCIFNRFCGKMKVCAPRIRIYPTEFLNSDFKTFVKEFADTVAHEYIHYLAPEATEELVIRLDGWRS